MRTSTRCPCETVKSPKVGNAFEEFAALREKCPVLKELLVPDKIWQDFQKKGVGLLGDAQHASILWLAFLRGYLNRITMPIHHYLFDGHKLHDGITKGYKNDLAESWFFKEDDVERHEKSRIYQGKLIELLCAYWMEEQGWRIEGLEAIGGKFDIEAISCDGFYYAIETKYIGQDNFTFRKLLECLKSNDRVAGGSSNLYTAKNYVLFRIYEAALQLEKSKCKEQADDKKHMAVIVIDDTNWQHAITAIQVLGMGSRPFCFSNSASAGWSEFIKDKINANDKIKTIESNLDMVIGHLDDLRILALGSGLVFKELYKLPPA